MWMMGDWGSSRDDEELFCRADEQKHAPIGCCIMISSNEWLINRLDYIYESHLHSIPSNPHIHLSKIHIINSYSANCSTTHPYSRLQTSSPLHSHLTYQTYRDGDDLDKLKFALSSKHFRHLLCIEVVFASLKLPDGLVVLELL